MIKWSEMQSALADAREDISRADTFVSQMVEIIAGRLRKGGASAHYLKQLKRELQDFDSRTGSWRS